MCRRTIPVTTVLIIDFVTDYYVNSTRLVEVSFKIADLLNNNTRIDSFVYRPHVCRRAPKTMDDVYEPMSGYGLLENGAFFRHFAVIITRGRSNKTFIKQFCDVDTMVVDIVEDDIPKFLFAASIHHRNTRLTHEEINAWRDPSRCPRSTCRNKHVDGARESCSFKNVKCMINWLNNPIF